ncbi:MAG: LuxR C-terminal-related transcriptional regulator [Brumimicrobium sp.]
MLDLFSPGDCYFYVVNFHNLKMDYAHSGTEKVLGILPEEFTTERFLDHFSEEEIQKFKEKEAFVADFLFNYLSPEELSQYKVSYFLEITSKDGVKKKLLHQATTLTVTETGKVEHVLGVHTDVSHFDFSSSETVSFIHLSGGQSYYHCNYKSGKLLPALSTVDMVKDIPFTKKENVVIELMAEGLNSAQIAEKLNNTKNTIDTHRRNIIKKAGCSNIIEVISRCLVEGLIQ